MNDRTGLQSRTWSLLVVLALMLGSALAAGCGGSISMAPTLTLTSAAPSTPAAAPPPTSTPTSAPTETPEPIGTPTPKPAATFTPEPTAPSTPNTEATTAAQTAEAATQKATAEAAATAQARKTVQAQETAAAAEATAEAQVPLSPTPIPEPPTPTSTEAPLVVEAPKPSWASIDEYTAYGGDPNVLAEAQYWQIGQRNLGLNLPRKNVEDTNLPMNERAWGPVNMRIGRLVEVDDVVKNNVGEEWVQLTVQFDVAGQEEVIRWYALRKPDPNDRTRFLPGYPGYYVYKVPTLDRERGPYIFYVDHAGDTLTAEQKHDLLRYLASRKMSVGVRDDYETTDFVICLGLQ